MIEVDWLRNIFIVTRLESLSPRFWRIMSRYGHNWHGLEAPLLANLARRGKPVQLRQTQIHQDENRARFDRDLHRLFAIAGFQHVVPRHFEQPSHHKTAVLEILYDQKDLFSSLHYRPRTPTLRHFTPGSRISSIRSTWFVMLS